MDDRSAIEDGQPTDMASASHQHITVILIGAGGAAALVVTWAVICVICLRRCRQQRKDRRHGAKYDTVVAKIKPLPAIEMTMVRPQLKHAPMLTSQSRSASTSHETRYPKYSPVKVTPSFQQPIDKTDYNEFNIVKRSLSNERLQSFNLLQVDNTLDMRTRSFSHGSATSYRSKESPSQIRPERLFHIKSTLNRRQTMFVQGSHSRDYSDVSDTSFQETELSPLHMTSPVATPTESGQHRFEPYSYGAISTPTEASDTLTTTMRKGHGKRSMKVLTKEASQSECGTLVSLTIKYDWRCKQLQIELLSASDMPSKCFGLDVSGKIFLYPHTDVNGVTGKHVLGQECVQFNEAFVYDEMTPEDVETSTMHLILQYKKQTRSYKWIFLCDVFVNFGDHNWTSSPALTLVDLPLTASRTKAGTPEKYMLKDLGSLFVGLEYQRLAQRMKVMVRKASNLPKSDKLIGEPGHYVEIYLLRDDEVVKIQETKTHHGYNPIWNQPFIFDIKNMADSQYSIDFVLMRKRLGTRDAVVGHVAIGENVGRTGQEHWKEIMSPRPAGIAKWHTLAPVLY